MPEIRRLSELVRVEVFPSRGPEKFQVRMGKQTYRVHPDPTVRCTECRDAGWVEHGRIAPANHPRPGQIYASSNPCGACLKGRETATRLSTCERCHAPLNPSTMKCTDVKCKMKWPQRAAYVATFHEIFPEQYRQKARDLLRRMGETVEEQNPPEEINNEEPLD